MSETLPSDALPDELLHALHDEVERAFEGEQLPFFQRLVEQPSHTYAKDDVEAAHLVVDALADELGLARELHPDPGGRFADHRVYRTPATGAEDRAVALVGHVDTVFPRSLGFLRFERDGDVARGPGVLDMKSGLSSILFALRALKAARPERYAQLKARFVCVSDEEVGSPSSAPLYEALAPRTDAALVFEAGRDEDRVVVARKGAGAFRLTARGRAAHAGNRHHEGVNAIVALSLVIPRVEGLTDYARGLTLNVGLVEGGTAKNTVPDSATCVVDARFIHLEDGAHLLRALDEIAADPFRGLDGEVVTRVREATFELSGGISRPPMEAHDDSQRLRERYEVHARAAGLKTGAAPLQGGGSDANLLAAQGVPCIDGLGPYGQHFHKVEEWSSLESLKRRTQALACFLASIA